MMFDKVIMAVESRVHHDWLVMPRGARQPENFREIAGLSLESHRPQPACLSPRPSTIYLSRHPSRRFFYVEFSPLN